MDRTDYEGRADEAVRSFIDNKKPLGDSIVEIAHRDSLNPEQIKRIVEMANTGAFLEMFKSTSGDDRMVEFPTADAGSILKKFYDTPSGADGETPPHTRGVSFFDDVADENAVDSVSGAYLGAGLDDALKSAAWEPRVKFASAQKLAMRVDRVHSTLKDRVAAAYYEAEDIATKLSRKFASVYDREKLAGFEADGLALYGPQAVFAFNAVRESLREPTYARLPDAGQVKTAAEFHLANSNTEEMKLLGEFISKISSLRKFQHAKQALEVEYEL